MQFVPPPPPPRDEAELVDRARRLAGLTLGRLAAERRIQVPQDLRRAKGWAGLVLEQALGATASSRALPDFPDLGVELKSIPVDERGRPRESTYVCTAPLDGTMPRQWRRSWVYKKLARVLWIPLVSPRGSGPADRIVGSPVLWTPDADEEAVLRADYEELTELIDMGRVWQLDARRGRALQLRPKGAHGDHLVWALDEEAEWVRTSPRGFYLRARFTGEVLARRLLLPGA
ncbi:MAG: DNA mismatch repair endonuclease MutH [Deltaproteobacteria bacterium]|nr:MAG: DNA mismatch repair endonuclease MutH [Deltaproteobacteria bacterium]